ncbi:MAG TPA: prenyltransferase/squalene oxidase repeat-containing protein [Planctomycetaceae bacterium]|nr:prenyltransferase/squalene oxidase repeat-containing protein [Planctomycetaceae bacterium]
MQSAFARVRNALLAERTAAGHWDGELSTSALSTATAVVALTLCAREGVDRTAEFERLAAGGIAWLAEHQNADGGWGDTLQSLTNISTTMLARAAFEVTGMISRYPEVVARAQAWIDRAGGVEAVRRRYGRDHTFSVPILTQCALAGLVDWREIPPLPFELACLPANFYKWIRLPVVSYALPALIAIGQVRHFKQRTGGPLWGAVRDAARAKSLRILERIQPASGGFLEATPLTSFVVMSLAGMHRADHPVVQRGLEFLVRSVRPDGSWPIDTNLATWTTTLSVNALGVELPGAAASPVLEWLLGQQYREVHPYTNAAPGGWAWTDLTGGVPDADDTPGAILALLSLVATHGPDLTIEQVQAVQRELPRGVNWLLDLQNADGGWPTFCRGWGALPFDRSSQDLTAHAIRALHAWRTSEAIPTSAARPYARAERAIHAGFRYLHKTQRPDGSWLPLWFGNQFAHDDENPTYGTSRVLLAYRDIGLIDSPEAQRGLAWLRDSQNVDGGWGGAAGIESSVEETALALDAVLADGRWTESAARGADWLAAAVESGRIHRPTPIGFYFAKLWYSEKLYPLIFTTSALRNAERVRLNNPRSEPAAPPHDRPASQRSAP